MTDKAPAPVPFDFMAVPPPINVQTLEVLKSIDDKLTKLIDISTANIPSNPPVIDSHREQPQVLPVEIKSAAKGGLLSRKPKF